MRQHGYAWIMGWLCFLCCEMYGQGATVYFVDEYDRLFVEKKQATDKIYGFIMDGFYEGPNIWWQLARSLEFKGYSVKHVKNIQDVHADYCAVVVTNMHAPLIAYLQSPASVLEKSRLIFIMWEPPSVNPLCHTQRYLDLFGTVLTWSDDLVTTRGYTKIFYPRQQLCTIEETVPFEEKKLCCMVASFLHSTYPLELYSERVRTAEFFEHYASDDFDLYGCRGWQERAFKVYKGSVAKKIETVKKYRFCICYENIQKMNGYITEKIFDCFHAKCVPVYWGADNVGDYIPPSCFVDRRAFLSDEGLYTFLKSITAEQYESYLGAVEDYFAYDPRAQLFSVNNFIATMMHVIAQVS